MVLRNIEAALARGAFQVRAQHLDFSAGDAAAVKLPKARVYVLDSHGPRLAVQKLIESLLNQQPRPGLVVLAEKFTEATAFPLLRMGVRGLLTYAELGGPLPRAVELVARGSYWVPRALLGRFVDSVLQRGPARPTAEPARLSRREQEVMDALLENLANKEIAARLNISERTVKFHVSKILSKFRVQRRADLILRFYQERSRYS